jgi:hypothetical protein
MDFTFVKISFDCGFHNIRFHQWKLSSIIEICQVVLLYSSTMPLTLEVISNSLNLGDDFQWFKDNFEACSHLPCGVIFSISLCHLEALPPSLKSLSIVHCHKLSQD